MTDKNTDDNIADVIDISSRMTSRREYDILSNFALKPFTIDGISFQCLEGFLQCLKTDDEETQLQFCEMKGSRAKMTALHIDWKSKQTLYWRGRAYGRHTEEYQHLISRAFQECYDQCAPFRRILAQTGNAVLTHTIGKDDPTDTILTIDEFVGRLTKLRQCGKLL